MEGKELHRMLQFGEEFPGVSIVVSVKRQLSGSPSISQLDPRDIAFAIFNKNDVTPLGLSYIIDTFKAIILSSLRDLKASMAEIIIGWIWLCIHLNPARGDTNFKSDFYDPICAESKI